MRSALRHLQNLESNCKAAVWEWGQSPVSQPWLYIAIIWDALTLRHTPKSNKSESQRLEPRHQYFKNLFKWFQWAATVENHWLRAKRPSTPATMSLRPHSFHTGMHTFACYRPVGEWVVKLGTDMFVNFLICQVTILKIQLPWCH